MLFFLSYYTSDENTFIKCISGNWSSQNKSSQNKSSQNKFSQNKSSQNKFSQNKSSQNSHLYLKSILVL